MMVTFNFLFNKVKYDMTIVYESDDLYFSNRIQATPDNIRYLINRFSTIDRIQHVIFTCRKPLEVVWDGAVYWFRLHAHVYLYPSKTILSWNIDGNDDLPEDFINMMNIHLGAIHNNIVGTASHWLPDLKDAAKATVKANANRRARIMRANAEAIMTFLGEDF